MGKWWHTIASIGLAAVAIVTPPVQNAISGHPAVSTVLGIVWAILGHMLPSPVVPTTAK